MKCPKCGYENTEDSLFCEECGWKLTEDKITCPACGAKVRIGAKHCNKCGASLIKQDEQEEITEAKPVKESKLETITLSDSTRLFRGLQLFVLVVGVILLFVGMFGSMIAAKITSAGNSLVEDSYPIPYLFGDMFKGIESMKGTKHESAYGTYLFLAVFTLLSYIIMLIGIVSFGIGSLYKCFKNYEKPKIVNKAIIGLIATTLPYLCLMTFTFVTKSIVKVSSTQTNSIGIVYGWGSGLLIAGLILCLISYIMSSIDTEGVKGNGKLIVAEACSKIASFTLVLFFLFGFSYIIQATTGTTKSFGSVIVRMATDQQVWDAGYDLSKGFPLAVIGYVFTVIAMFMSFFVVPGFLYKESKNTISLVGLNMTIYFVGIIFTIAAGNINGPASEAHFGASGMWWLTLAIGLITLLLLMVVGCNKYNKKAGSKNQPVEAKEA